VKILLAEHFGTCFGVRDAIAQAEQVAADQPLTILGELVHNPIVRERLRASGIQEASPDATGVASRRVMITAHGTSDRNREKWQTAGYDVVDGTCPLVRHAHEQLKRLVAAGYFPVVIGKSGHVEVRGLTGDFPDAYVVNTEADICTLPVRDRYGVISQTTQPLQHVRALVATLRKFYPQAEVQFVDTICKPTKDRQAALQDLIAKADTIVVIGGRHSNNTRQLVAACQSAGRRCIHVERPEELDSTDFRTVNTVGLTAGTSTLRETVEAVLKRLEEFSSHQLKQSNQQQSHL
jgi:4-hydroxy-3-methylbut-2-en-1-yl diphosphate reductase